MKALFFGSGSSCWFYYSYCLVALFTSGWIQGSQGQFTASEVQRTTLPGFKSIDYVAASPTDPNLYWLGATYNDISNPNVAELVEFDAVSFAPLRTIDIPTNATFLIRVETMAAYQDMVFVITIHRSTTDSPSNTFNRYELSLLRTTESSFSWTVDTLNPSMYGRAPPTFSADGSLVYVNYWNGQNIAYSTTDGSIVWSTPPNNSTTYSGFTRSTDGTRLFGINLSLSCNRGVLAGVDAYDPNTGSIVDRYEAPSDCVCGDTGATICNNAWAPGVVDAQNRLHYTDDLFGMVTLDGDSLATGPLNTAAFTNASHNNQGYVSPLLNTDESVVIGTIGDVMGGFSNPVAVQDWEIQIDPADDDSWVQYLYSGPCDAAASGECAVANYLGDQYAFDMGDGTPIWQYSALIAFHLEFRSSTRAIVFGSFQNVATIVEIATVIVPTEAPTSLPTASPISFPPTVEPTTSQPTTDSPVGTSSPTSVPSTASRRLSSWWSASLMSSVLVALVVILLSP